MRREIEIKFSVSDAAAMVARLTEAGAARRGSSFEINRIFDSPERRLLAAGCGLRLRQTAVDGRAAGQSLLTFKGPREPTGQAGLKSREEIETDVGDAVAAAAMLMRLGYAEVIRYEKRRETWRLDGCEVALDELPRLGWFVEVEGPDAAAVARVREKVALSEASVCEETYVAMAARDGVRDAAGRMVLAFGGMKKGSD